jgi:short subunit fatty acids transporter
MGTTALVAANSTIRLSPGWNADARGFGATKRRGSLRVHKITAVDIWGYVILFVLVVGALVLNHLNIGARYYG